MSLRRRVGTDRDGIRLDVFLGGQVEVGSRPRAKALIRAGRVQVEGRNSKPGLALRAGQVVYFEPMGVDEDVDPQGEPSSLARPLVLHEDPCILVIDKPAGMIAHPPGIRPRRPTPSVSTWAESHSPGLPVVAGVDRPGIVHRLDKDTSGVMVLAKTEDAFHFLKGEFKARRVKKEYRAICFGDARFDSDYKSPREVFSLY